MSDIEEMGAILQRDKKTYAIVPRTPVGMVTADILEKMAQVVRKHEIPIVKITSGQRLALVGLKEEQIKPVWEDLGMDIGHATALCLHYVQACPGTAVCKFGMTDSLGMGLNLEETFKHYDMPAKLKFGVSGCPMCCSESYLRDIGLFGKKKGWTIIIGGNAGGRPRIGDEIASDISKDEAIALITKILDYYIENAKKKERMSRFVDRVGIDKIKADLL